MISTRKRRHFSNQILIVLFSITTNAFLAGRSTGDVNPSNYYTSARSSTTIAFVSRIASSLSLSKKTHRIINGNNKIIRTVTPTSLNSVFGDTRTEVTDNDDDYYPSGQKSLAWQLLQSTKIPPHHHYLISNNTSHSDLAQQQQILRLPLIIGHRGSLYKELENTLASFQSAAATGSDGIELDVFLLKCGTLVVFHGSGTDENPGCLRDYCCRDGGDVEDSRSILDFTYEEARNLIRFDPDYEEFGCPRERILYEKDAYVPTLEQVLVEMKKIAGSRDGFVVKIELKGPGTVEPVLEMVERLNMVDVCHFSSFSLPRLKRLRELRPERLPLQNGTSGTTNTASWRYKTGALFDDDIPLDFVELSRDVVGASEVHLKYDTCTEERVAAIHAAGMDSMAWFRGPIGMREDARDKYHDVGNEDESMYRIVMGTGVRSLCVNRPDLLVELLGERRRRG